MGIFRQFPYTNFHELNMDWLLEIVRDWVEKSEDYFTTTDEKIEYIEANFDNLKEYVTNFLQEFITDSNLNQLVSDKMDEMYEAGDFDEILGQNIMRWTDLRVDTLNGQPIMRHREYYADTSVSPVAPWSMQEAIVYASDGNYTKNGANRYIYYWKTNSTNTKTWIRTFDITAQRLVKEVPIGSGTHGGCFVIRGTTLYTLDNTHHYLYIFDISNPADMQIIESRLLPESITCTNLVGWIEEENRWLMATNKSVGAGSHIVYYVDEDFTEQKLAYVLEAPSNITNQDFKYDPNRKVIYQTTTWPNLINVYSAINGKLITSVKIPQHASYVNTGEIEWFDCHGNDIYFGGMCRTGVVGSVQAEFNAWHTTMTGMNLVRDAIYVVSGRRRAYVSTEFSPLNPPDTFNLAVNNMRFRYMEDALNYVRSAQGGEVSIQSDYDYSFHVNCDVFLECGAHTLRAFKVDENVTCRITGLQTSQAGPAGFAGPPATYTHSGTGNAVSCYIYIAGGAHVTVNNITGMPTNSRADFLIWNDRGTLELTDNPTVHDMFVSNGFLIGTGRIGQNFTAINSFIDVDEWDLRYHNTQFCADNCTIKAAIVNGNARRPTIDWLIGKKFNHEAFMTFGSGGAINGRPLADIPIFAAGMTPVTIQWAYWSQGSNEYNQCQFVITPTLVKSPVGFNAKQYTLSYGDTRPSETLRDYLGVVRFA